MKGTQLKSNADEETSSTTTAGRRLQASTSDSFTTSGQGILRWLSDRLPKFDAQEDSDNLANGNNNDATSTDPRQETGTQPGGNTATDDKTTTVNGEEMEEVKEEGSLQSADDQFHTPALRWYNPVRNVCGKIVNDERFQVFIVFLIILNAALMGIGTYDFVEDNPKVQHAFDTADLAFLIVFTIESGLQLLYHGYMLFYDGWLVFDLFVVLLSWSLDSVQIFRAIRVFRAFRLVARLDVLKELVNAIVQVLPRLGSIMLLFSLVLYIYSVLCTVLFGDYTYGDANVDYFGRLDYSLFTLFQFVTLEAWGEVSREIMEIYPWAQYIFLSFLMVSSFILYSLVVAVVCDAVAVVEHPDIALKKFEEKMKKEQNETKRRVRKLRRHLDELSLQQMQTLVSVQNSLMKYNRFRRDAEASDYRVEGT